MLPSQPPYADQSFDDAELLFRRVRRENLRPDGRPTLMAFELPDMSVNRGNYGTAESARRGFDPADWAVVSFAVADIPARRVLAHVADKYVLLPRHVPEPGNFPHAEVRVWREKDGVKILVTHRGPGDFSSNDPDGSSPNGTADALLDPDFHMRWRKHISRVAKLVVPLKTSEGTA